MFTKKAHFKFTEPMPLNVPRFKNDFIVDQHLKVDTAEVDLLIKKIAAQVEATHDIEATHDKEGIPDHIVAFNLEAEIQAHPDSLFVKCFAIKADEMNDNGDWFGCNELKKATPTFIGVPVFTNHNNSDAEAARGKVVHSWWDDGRNGIMIIARVDGEAYPQLARGIREEYILGTSMGCFLGHNRVLMADGTYCPIEDIQSGDEVITHKGNIKSVVNLQRHIDKENDEILHITIRGIKDSIDTTKDHPFYVPIVQKQCACGCGRKVDNNYSVPFKKYQKKYLQGHYQKTTIKISDIRNNFSYEWKKSGKLKVGDLVCVPRMNVSRSGITTDEAKLIGLFLAEGSYLKYKDTKTAVEFNFALSERDSLGQLTVDLLKSVFPGENIPTTQIRKDRNIFMVRLHGKDVARWFFINCGEYSHSKKLSPDILLENRENLLTLIGCFISGDGHLRDVNNRQNYNIWTTSHCLRDQFNTILNKLGIKHSTTALVNGKSSTLRKAAGMGSIPVDYVGVDTRRPSYCLQIGQHYSSVLSDYAPHKTMSKFINHPSIKFVTDEFILTPITSITRSYNSDPVYTLEVEDDHSYVVEGVAVKNCQVKYSVCSICHNAAESPAQYCEHIRERKTRNISASKVKCAYHKHGNDEVCPLCNSTKKEKKTFAVKDVDVFEYNYGIKFIENSFVVNPACHDCGVTEIIDPSRFLAKVAEIERTLPRLLKVAQETDVICTDQGCTRLASKPQVDVIQEALDFLSKGAKYIKKFAGQEQINDLNQALNLLTSVSQDMLQQKDQIDLEFLSDLVTVLADLQTVTDELTEQGYGRLPSPGTAQQQTPDQGQGQPAQPAQTAPPTPAATGGASKVHSGPAGGAGTVTSPMASKKFDLEKLSQGLLSKIQSFPSFLNSHHLQLNKYEDDKNFDITFKMKKR